jgi:hypothetical protein
MMAREPSAAAARTAPGGVSLFEFSAAVLEKTGGPVSRSHSRFYVRLIEQYHVQQ